MATEILSSFECGDTTIQYRITPPGKNRNVGLWMVPSPLASRVAVRREILPDWHMPWEAGPFFLDSLAHVKRVGDAYAGGFTQGRTLRPSAMFNEFKFVAQRVAEEQGGQRITTELKSARGDAVIHELWWHGGDQAVRVRTTYENRTDKPIGLEMLTSFNLGGISPLAADDAPERLWLHRLRSYWSVEGRLVSEPIEQLHLERSWTGHAVGAERFGQVGSMPVRGFFPFVAVGDKAANVLWGAQLAWAGSWQMELYRQDDCLSVSGGLADRELGHWTKTIQPGEKLASPVAMLACVQGDMDDLCGRLTNLQQAAAEQQPEVEKDLPICFNEWPATWGKPTHEVMVQLADKLKDTGAKYLVIDAGWFKSEEGGDWNGGLGSWVLNEKVFPHGLAAVAKAIRERGLIPGLWFEWEVASEGMAGRPELVPHFLQRDGRPLRSGGRVFWNLQDPWVVDYLTTRMIDVLGGCGFGYLKVDYNDHIGIGCDDPDSQGEGLRKHIEAVYRFFQRIRERLPDLVIENCASGGHRLEPSLQGMTAVGSFSDAHEVKEIPIVAANLHRAILPRQSLIWAVLRKSDSQRRMIYSLAATFLGRMCLSGDILDFTDAQWATYRSACDLYRRVWPIIKHGFSRRYGETGKSYRYPRGWQAVVRVAENRREALVVAHSFAQPLPECLDLPLPEVGSWRIMEEWGGAGATLEGVRLKVPLAGEFDARVLHLRA
ncbi:MAG: alpha-galactosidase [Phycisphaeraceae bacterium]|nr:alpha-galactosidase [Phycisphaeraceae bacterium]